MSRRRASPCYKIDPKSGVVTVLKGYAYAGNRARFWRRHDPRIAAAEALARRMMEVVDGEYTEYVGRDMRTKEEREKRVLISEREDNTRRGAFIREHFSNTPELKSLVRVANRRTASLKAARKRRSDERQEKRKMVRKAFLAMPEHTDRPTHCRRILANESENRFGERLSVRTVLRYTNDL